MKTPFISNKQRDVIHPAADVTDFELNSGGRRQVAHLDHGGGEVGKEGIDGVTVRRHGVAGGGAVHQLLVGKQEALAVD
nr:hypothetical protein Iba_chr06fCG3860 [Ipomoea batatas]